MIARVPVLTMSPITSGWALAVEDAEHAVQTLQCKLLLNKITKNKFLHIKFFIQISTEDITYT